MPVRRAGLRHIRAARLQEGGLFRYSRWTSVVLKFHPCAARRREPHMLGIRVVKTAIAAVIAVFLASMFSLQFATSAGLLAILGTDVTRKRSLRTAFIRSVASIVGLLFGVFIFQLFGFALWVIGVYILAAYPILARLKLKDGIVTSSVIVFHVFSLKSVAPPVILNEIFLLLIGLGSAMCVNLAYMPRSDQRLRELRILTEDLFAAILMQLSRHLKFRDAIWDGKELIQAQDAIAEGLELTARSSENQLFVHEEYSRTYFGMRRDQLDSIQRMVQLVAQVYETVPHCVLAAELFEALSVDVRSEYYTGNVESRLAELERRFREMALPQTRAEFEVRSAVFQLCLELERYLSIAKSKKKKYLSP